MTDVPIDVLGLSTRAYNALARAGIKTVGEAAQLGYEDILDLRNIGDQTAREIDATLTRYIRKRVAIDTLAQALSKPEPASSTNSETRLPDEWQQRFVLLARDTSPITDLHLSRRTNNALYRAGYLTVGDIASTPTDKLMTARNIGGIAIAEIDKRLTARLNDPSSWQITDPELVAPPDPPPDISGSKLFAEWLATSLNDREREVITLRYGLKVDRLTLAEIGQRQHVSRERIRQIEKKAKQKLTRRRHMLVDDLGTKFVEFITEQSGVVTIDEGSGWLVKEHEFPVRAAAVGAVELLCEMDDRFTYLSEQEVICLAELPIDAIDHIQTHTVELLNSLMAPTPAKRLVSDYGRTLIAQAMERQWPEATGIALGSFIYACLRTHPGLEEREPLVFAIRKWDNRIADNIIVALRELGEPSHFSAITKAVNKQLAADKKTNEHNVQAHMLRYKEHFVRVGHGIYGLAEWGLEKPGSVAETAASVLREAGHPLHINTITETVLKTWQVNPATVYAALTNEAYYRSDSGNSNLAMLLGESIFSLTEWEEARGAEGEPVLPFCPPLPPDPPNFDNALFESIIVGNNYLQTSPQADAFLISMFKWAKASTEQNRWLQQGVLNTYYLLGLIPYTYIFSGDNPRLHSTLPVGSVAETRYTCLRSLNRRLVAMSGFWGLLQQMQPVRQKELSEAFAPVRGDGLDDTAPRLALLAGMGAVVRGSDWHYRLTAFGVQAAKELGQLPKPQPTHVSTPTTIDHMPSGSDDLSDLAFWE